MSRPYAETVNYWKSGSSSPDTWLDKCRHEISTAGGTVTGSAFMENGDGAGFALLFTLAGEQYRINWPVLPLRPNARRTATQQRTDERAAKIQATTFMYHDIKARCMVVKIMRAAAAFLQYKLLPGGATAAEMGFSGRGADIPQGLLRLGDGA